MPGVRRSPRPITALATAVVAVAATLALVAPAQAAAPAAPAGLDPDRGESGSAIPTLTWSRVPGATRLRRPGRQGLRLRQRLVRAAPWSTTRRRPDYPGCPRAGLFWRVRAGNRARQQRLDDGVVHTRRERPAHLAGARSSATLKQPDRPAGLQVGRRPWRARTTPCRSAQDGSFVDPTCDVTLNTSAGVLRPSPAARVPSDLLLARSRPRFAQRRFNTDWSSPSTYTIRGLAGRPSRARRTTSTAPCRT